jgi:Ca-activated chloride channel family protein
MGPRPRSRALASPRLRSAGATVGRRAIGLGAALIVAALTVAGCTASGPDEGESGEGDFADDGCTHIAVATSSEKVNMLDALAEAFKESPEAEALDECATVRPVNVSSGDATRFLTAGDDWPSDNPELWPTLWSPASTVWTERVAAAASPALVGEPESFTRTPVVFGMPEAMARALGWPDRPISITDIEKLC